MNAAITNPAKDPRNAKSKAAHISASRIGSTRLLSIVLEDGRRIRIAVNDEAATQIRRDL